MLNVLDLKIFKQKGQSDPEKQSDDDPKRNNLFPLQGFSNVCRCSGRFKDSDIVSFQIEVTDFIFIFLSYKFYTPTGAGALLGFARVVLALSQV